MTPEEMTRLRMELKDWENSFAATHGRKPGRDDIKRNPEMAAKYKAYSKLREPPPDSAAKTRSSTRSSKPTTSTSVSSPSKRAPPSKPLFEPRTPSRRSRRGTGTDTGTSPTTGGDDTLNDDPFQTPSMRSRTSQMGSVASRTSIASSRRHHNQFQTPTHARFTNTLTASPHTPTHREYDSPISARRLRFQVHDTVGPTPQKAGKVLGIFESAQVEGTPPRRAAQILSESSAARATSIKKGIFSPSKRTRTDDSASLMETPKKRSRLGPDVESSPSIRSSIGRSGRNGSAQTPSKNDPPSTPYHLTTREQDLFATPTFLRRTTFTSRITTAHGHNTSTLDESLEDSPPLPMRIFKPPVRGLSSMLADLRKLQDEVIDEDMEMLREMEMEAEMGGGAGGAGGGAGTGAPAGSKPKPPSISRRGVLPVPSGWNNATVRAPTTTTASATALVPAAPESPQPPEDLDFPDYNNNDFDTHSQDHDDFDTGMGEPTVGGYPGAKPEQEPRRAWKKKGLKRQTRRVKMRPVRSKPTSSTSAPQPKPKTATKPRAKKSTAANDGENEQINNDPYSSQDDNDPDSNHDVVHSHEDTGDGDVSLPQQPPRKSSRVRNNTTANGVAAAGNGGVSAREDEFNNDDDDDDGDDDEFDDTDDADEDGNYDDDDTMKTKATMMMGGGAATNTIDANKINTTSNALPKQKPAAKLPSKPKVSKANKGTAAKGPKGSLPAKVAKTPAAGAAATKKSAGGGGGGGGPVSRMNFCRLKIRNQSGAKGGGGGRFFKRRR